MGLSITPGVVRIGESGDKISGDVTLVQGANVTITRSGQSITIASSGGGGGSSTTEQDITQTSHGFAVGDAISFDSGSYVKADASDITKLGFLVVTAVAGVDDFTAAQAGYYNVFSGLTADTYYFVDPTTPGTWTATEPTGTDYSNPIFHAVSTTGGWILPFRPSGSTGIVDGGSFTGSGTDTLDGGAF